MRAFLLALCCLLLVSALGPGTRADSGTVYYVYAPACGSCAKMKPVLDALDAPGLAVVEIDIFREPERAAALFARYGVPEPDRLAPAVFVGDRVIVDAAEAAQTLQGLIDAGEAQKTPPEGGDIPGGAPAVSLLGTAAAGLVAGFNPCALSMLLFFLALLLPLPRGAAGAATAFLAAKLLAYLLIGTALVSVFRAWNPSWLPLASKWLLTVVGAALVILNLNDALRALRGEYGQIKNQLPRGLRAFLHRSMKRTLQDPGPRLVIVSAALGLVVAATEFLCSGQLYLATLTAALERGERTGAMLCQLALFCIMFLLPSAVCAALMLRGKQALALSGWMLGRMPLIKLLTALAMAAVIAAAWFV